MPAYPEQKPPWSAVPRSVRAGIEALLGARVLRGRRVYGGFGPSATFSVSLSNGKRAFCKAAWPGYTQVGWAGVRQELRMLREVPAIRPFSAAFIGAVEGDGWLALLMEEIAGGPKALPWTPRTIAASIATVAALHRATEGAPLPAWIPDLWSGTLFAQIRDGEAGWSALVRDPAARAAATTAFSDPSAAAAWLAASLPTLDRAQRRGVRDDAGRCLLHLDLRSDNIVFRPGGEPVLLDWTWVATGPPLIDVSFLYPSMCAEGAGEPEEILGAYARASGRTFTMSDIGAAAAMAAGYFAHHSGLPEHPQLPRLRWVQRRQLAGSLPFAAKVLGLPTPPAVRV